MFLVEFEAKLAAEKLAVEQLAAEQELAAPTVPERAPAAVAGSGVPRLPRIDGPADIGPHRE